MAEAENKKEGKAVKKDKVSFWKKIGTFFKGLRSECKKIVWYGKSQTVKGTVLVIVCLVIVAAVIGLIDIGLTAGISWLGDLV